MQLMLQLDQICRHDIQPTSQLICLIGHAFGSLVVLRRQGLINFHPMQSRGEVELIKGLTQIIHTQSGYRNGKSGAEYY